MRNRLDEIFAKDAFSKFLQARGLEPTWEPAEDPPDGYVSIEGTRFAVEITLAMVSLQLGDKEIPLFGALAQLANAVIELQTLAEEKGLMRGFHHLHVCPVPDIRGALPKIRSRLLEYLADTSPASVGPRAVLWSEGRGQEWTIEKIPGEGDGIGHTTSTSGAKWEGEIRSDLTKILQARIGEKAKKTASIPEEKILLLVDAYHLGEPDDWAAAELPFEATAFHTIARVYQGHECQLLKCKAPFEVEATGI